jgi:purine nucleosidase
VKSRLLVAFSLASALCGAGAFGVPARRKVIIDQDAFGGVNLQPILLVIQSADVEVVGITIESGDGWQKESVAHTLRLLELVGRTDIPVVPGATYPLINSQEETRRWEQLYGKMAYKGAWMESWPSYNTVNRPHYHAADVVPPLEEGPPTTRPAAEVAAAFLARKVREAPGEISILALGPFTNLALAAKLDEGFAANAKELVFMGGSFNPDGSRVDEFSLQFINNPRVEFNCRWDPEAARIMLHAPWRKITAVPSDAPVGTRLTPELAREAAAAGTPAGRYLARFGETGFPMWDETAAAAWLQPALVRRSDRLAMDIVIDHGSAYGSTLSWAPGGGPGLGEPDVTVVRAIDIPGLERLFVRLLSQPTPPP